MINQSFVRFIGLIMFISGVGIVYFSFGEFVSGKDSLTWSEAPAVVTQSDQRLSSAKASYRWIEYSYRYGEYSFTSENIGYMLSFSKANSVTEGLKTGSMITVYVNPRDPAQAVVVKGLGSAIWLYGVLGVGFVIFGVLMFFAVRAE